MKVVPDVPALELMQIKEKWYNKLNQLSMQATDNPFQQMQSIIEFIGAIYSEGFKSGYMQSDIDGVVNNSQPG